MNAKKKVRKAKALGKAMAAVMAGATAFSTAACQLPMNTNIENENYPNIGNEKYIIENHSPLAGAELDAKVQKILKAFESLEANPVMSFFSDYARNNGTKIIIAVYSAEVADGPDVPNAWAVRWKNAVFLKYDADYHGPEDVAIREALAHEILHVAQFAALPKSAFSGLRPDVRASLGNFIEATAYFFSSNIGVLMPTEFNGAEEWQSRIFVDSVDPKNAEDITFESWTYYASFSRYAKKEFAEALSRRQEEVRAVSNDEILSLMRIIADTKPPYWANVSDAAISAAYDVLHAAYIGESPYVRIGNTDGVLPADISAEDMNAFKKLCADWDARLAANSRTAAGMSR